MLQGRSSPVWGSAWHRAAGGRTELTAGAQDSPPARTGRVLDRQAADTSVSRSTVFSVDRSGRDTAELDFTPWAGTVDQLVQAARHAADEIAELMPFPDGYDPEQKGDFDAAKYAEWKDAEAARKMQIVVQEKEGFTGRPSLDEQPVDDSGARSRGLRVRSARRAAVRRRRHCAALRGGHAVCRSAAP